VIDVQVRHSWQLEAESVRASAFAVHMVALGKVVFTSRNIIALEARAAISTPEAFQDEYEDALQGADREESKGRRDRNCKSPNVLERCQPDGRAAG
jgi:hypothetical protein